MKNNKFFITIILLVLLSFPLAASAGLGWLQKGQNQEGKAGDISMFLAMMIQKELELSDSQTLQIKKHLEKIEQYRMEQKKVRREILEQIRELLEKDGQDAAFTKAVKSLQEHKAKVDGDIGAMEKDLLKIMTPRQQAKYLVFERSFRERIKDRMRQFRDGKKPFREGKPRARRQP